MKKLVPLFLLFTLIYSCTEPKTETFTDSTERKLLAVSFDDMEIEGDLGSFTIEKTLEELAEGLYVVHLKMHSNQPASPPRFSLKWDIPSADIYSIWTPSGATSKISYWGGGNVTSRATSWGPVVSHMDRRGQNRITLAVSEVLNEVSINSWLREEDARFYYRVSFFNEYYPALTEYQVDLRIDLRDKPWYKSIDEVSSWWASMENVQPAPVPEDARKPVYSTWYSFHQNLVVDEVLAECRIASNIGMEALIVDDGWQTMDNKRGYRYTGDWKPERIPQMRSFVDSVHALGMKFMLWYSVPFIGENADNFSLFRGKYLTYWDSQGAWVLDPRYPEVREFIIKTYEEAMQRWDLDGFKLDFMAWFRAQEDTDLTALNGRDFASVNTATDFLMTEIMRRLRELNPEVMIEFRQPYIGPLMRKYGNMFRATDCPNEAQVNRLRIADLRTMAGNTAVHSDMFMWHKTDPVENAALQILNVLFAVPQVSVRLVQIPQEHLDMVTFWIEYWNRNQHVLLDGEFIPVEPDLMYPLLKGVTEEKTIAAVYADMVVDLPDDRYQAFDLVNAKGNSFVTFRLTHSQGKKTYTVYDCMGSKVDAGKVRLQAGIHSFTVPPSGLISFGD